MISFYFVPCVVILVCARVAAYTTSHTQVRLVQGLVDWDGLVEIYKNGQWGAVCANTFSENDAYVICKMLNVDGHRYPKFYHFRSYFGYEPDWKSIWKYQTHCYGNESDISQCWDEEINNNCSHSQDIGIDCKCGDRNFQFDPIPSELNENIISCDGTTNLIWNYTTTTETVTVIEWYRQPGQLIARIFGVNVGAPLTVVYPYNTAPYIVTLYNSSMYNAAIRITGLSSRDSAVYSVNITAAIPQSATLTRHFTEDNCTALTEGGDRNFQFDSIPSDLNENIISCEWTTNLIWNYTTNETVTVIEWYRQPSQLIARIFGVNVGAPFTVVYPYNTAPYTVTRYKPSMYNAAIRITGLSSRDSAIYSVNIISLSSHSAFLTRNFTDVGVKQVRLVGGYSYAEGRVEIYKNGEWGTVCPSGFSEDDAYVICKMLNVDYQRYPKIHYSSSYYGQGSGRVWTFQTRCRGYESDISQCWCEEGHNCSHSNDIGINCRSPGDGNTSEQTTITNRLLSHDLRQGSDISRQLQRGNVPQGKEQKRLSTSHDIHKREAPGDTTRHYDNKPNLLYAGLTVFVVVGLVAITVVVLRHKSRKQSKEIESI